MMLHATPDTVRSVWISIALAVRAGVAALGYGFTASRFLGTRTNLGDAGFLGLFCLALLGLTIHFAFPLSITVQAIVLFAGFVLASLQWRKISAACTLTVSATVLICAVMLVHALALPQSQSDMGGYHLQALRWAREYPVVPGLGNLHGRLAFNSVIIDMSALLDDSATRWIVNVLVATFFWISVFTRFQQLESEPPRGSDSWRRIYHWFLILLLSATALVPKLWGETWVLNADILAAYLVMYWVVLALGYAQSDQAGALVLLVMTSSLALAAKLSTAPLLLATCLFVWFHRKAGSRSLLRAAALSALLLVAWTGRSVLLSGCAVYPVRQTCMFSLPWAESPEMVYDESIAIRSWARLEGEGHFVKALHGWNWLPQWVKADWRQPLIMFLMLGFVAAAAGLFPARLRRGLSADLGLVCIGLAVSLSFWFLSAPDVRFASGSIFSAAALGLGLACAAWFRHPRLYSGWTARLMILLSAGGLLGIHTILLRPNYNRFAIPEPAVYSVDVGDGRKVWVPVDDNSCWDHPLPCTPFVNSSAIAKVRTRFAPANGDASAKPPVGWRPQTSVNPFPNEREFRELYR